MKTILVLACYISFLLSNSFGADNLKNIDMRNFVAPLSSFKDGKVKIFEVFLDGERVMQDYELIQQTSSEDFQLTVYKYDFSEDRKFSCKYTEDGLKILGYSLFEGISDDKPVLGRVHQNTAFPFVRDNKTGKYQIKTSVSYISNLSGAKEYKIRNLTNNYEFTKVVSDVYDGKEVKSLIARGVCDISASNASGKVNESTSMEIELWFTEGIGKSKTVIHFEDYALVSKLKTIISKEKFEEIRRNAMVGENDN